MRLGKSNVIIAVTIVGVAALALIAAWTLPVGGASAADQPADAAAVPAQPAATATEVTPTVPLDPAALTKKECSSCHMLFPPAFLPQRSWSALMAGLKDHFGENATLSAEQTAAIEGFLVEHAGDAGKKVNRWVRRISKDETPLRITETAAFNRAHSEEVSAARWKKAGSKANCAFCHRGAEKGIFGDDD